MKGLTIEEGSGPRYYPITYASDINSHQYEGVATIFVNDVGGEKVESWGGIEWDTVDIPDNHKEIEAEVRKELGI